MALVAILVGGAALRAGEAAQPRVHDESVDERFYGRLAQTLANNLNYGDRSSGPHYPFTAAPGAPFAFALAHRITPSPAATPSAIPAAYWVLAAVGTALIAATFGLGRHLGGPVAGLIAAALVAFYPPLVRTTGELLSEPLGALTVTLAALTLLSARTSDRRVLFASGGALLGLTALIRPDLLVLVFGCPLALAMLAWIDGRPRSGLRNAATVLAASVVILAPWITFASVRTGYFVPVIDGDVPALLIGSFLPGDGTNFGLKRALAEETRARVPGLRAVGDLQIPATAVIDTIRARHPSLTRREALKAEAFKNLRVYALGSPGRYAAMTLRKIGRMWLRPNQSREPVLMALHRGGLAIALAGLFAAIVIARSRGHMFLLSIIVASTLLHAVLVGHSRHALPLIPIVVAAGASSLFISWRPLAAMTSRDARAEP